MSRRRQPGEIVKRIAGSGFVSSDEPELLEIPGPDTFEYESGPCMLGCDDKHCTEFANLRIVGTNSYIYHLSECEMLDPLTTPEA